MTLLFLDMFLNVYILVLYREVVHHDEFLSLSVSEVGKMISSDRLTVTTEEQVPLIVLNQLSL